MIIPVDSRNNTLIGDHAGTTLLDTSTHNVCVGYYAGSNATGNYNTYIGQYCAQYATGKENVVIGDAAFQYGIGRDNVIVGKDACPNKASWSVIIGNNAGKSVTSSEFDDERVLIGTNVGYNDQNTYRNVYVGNYAGYGGSTSTNTTSNVFVGSYCGYGVQTGSYNVCVGTDSARSLTSGIKNVYIGTNSATGTSTGSNNVCIGYSASQYTGSDNYSVCLGSNTISTSDSISIGHDITNTTPNRIMIGNGTGSVYCDYNTNEVWHFSSDERLKKDISDCDLGIEFIEKIRPIKYRWNRPNETITTQMYGFSYQQLKKVLDDNKIEYTGLVDEVNGYGTVGSSALIPVLVKAVQELGIRVKKLQS
jgi:hypothetical protein